ncbi:MAG: choice-of-anchor Q domain-containing protein [Methylococcaceae bacterium]
MLNPSFPFRRHALALALALATGAADAATLNVSGGCTLINAINNANSDTDTDGASGCVAGSGADTLELTANTTYSLTTVNNNASGENGLPVISSTITINGNGATVERSNGAGTPGFRLLHIATAGNLTINKLKLTGGNPVTGTGGGIYNQGQMLLADSTVSGNSALGIVNGYHSTAMLVNSNISENSGGGIYNEHGIFSVVNSTISNNSGSGIGSTNNLTSINPGSLTVLNSTISSNSANVGGGLFIWAGSVTVTNSTISGNSATRGGGAYIVGYTDTSITLTNSTISDNSALTVGGVFTSVWEFDLTLTNCTISGNNAIDGGFIYDTSYGAGINVQIIHSTLSNNGGLSTISGHPYYAADGTITLTNSLIANSAGNDCSPSTVFVLQGINLVEDGSCGAPLTGDPKLRPLLDNGGLTLTHALKAHSPALAAADSALCEAFDQRDLRRPPACDLGAFERKTKIPESIAPLVQLFDAQVAAGELSGHVFGQAIDRRVALRNQLLTAGEYRNRHLNTSACDQLTRTLGYIDTDNSPEDDDYVTGSGAEALAQAITATRINRGCD